MGTLSSELGSQVDRWLDHPRIYADANLPSGIVQFMRVRLGWDVLFVIEHDDLRRSADQEHYRLARQLRRTLVSLDHDFFDKTRFPITESAGVIVISAPNERALERVLRRVDRLVFRKREVTTLNKGLPLSGKKLHVHPDWSGDEIGVLADTKD